MMAQGNTPSPAGILCQKEETETLVAGSAAGDGIGHVCGFSEHSNRSPKVKMYGLSLWKGGCPFLLVSSQICNLKMYFSVLPVLTENISNGVQSFHPPAAPNPSFAVQYCGEKVVSFPEDFESHRISTRNCSWEQGAWPVLITWLGDFHPRGFGLRHVRGRQFASVLALPLGKQFYQEWKSGPEFLSRCLCSITVGPPDGLSSPFLEVIIWEDCSSGGGTCRRLTGRV